MTNAADLRVIIARINHSEDSFRTFLTQIINAKDSDCPKFRLLEMSKYYEENYFVGCHFAFGETDSSGQVHLVVGASGGQGNGVLHLQTADCRPHTADCKL